MIWQRVGECNDKKHAPRSRRESDRFVVTRGNLARAGPTLAKGRHDDAACQGNQRRNKNDGIKLANLPAGHNQPSNPRPSPPVRRTLPAARARNRFGRASSNCGRTPRPESMACASRTMKRTSGPISPTSCGGSGTRVIAPDWPREIMVLDDSRWPKWAISRGWCAENPSPRARAKCGPGAFPRWRTSSCRGLPGKSSRRSPRRTFCPAAPATGRGRGCSASKQRATRFSERSCRR